MNVCFESNDVNVQPKKITSKYIQVYNNIQSYFHTEILSSLSGTQNVLVTTHGEYFWFLPFW